jgi:uncharacterized protein YbaR (Trm112 family)/SAM-dependent methyltransferase
MIACLIHRKDFMKPQLKLSIALQNLLCCPVCKEKIEFQNEHFVCTNAKCQSIFPVINDIPVLINEKISLFSFDDFLNHRNTTLNLRESKIRKLFIHFVPRISCNIKAKQNYRKFAELLLKQSKVPRVLVLGCRDLGEGIESLLEYSSIEMVYTDVSFGSNTQVIVDAHDIPFEKNAFDGVIIQAVLEHVVDPYRCVEEIHRVLKDTGIVYAETPFMQPVHERQYDFTRFTHLGHRRLFRKFEEIDSGPVCGSGTALAFSYKYFLRSFIQSNRLRYAVGTFAHITSFWLKYFDYFFINTPGTFDAAAGYFFLGRKSDKVLPDKELIKLYMGLR